MPVPCDSVTIGLVNLPLRPGATRTDTLRHLKAQFGDGYMNRRADGINARVVEWQVETPPMPIETVLRLEQELQAAELLPFDWTPPQGANPGRYIIEPPTWTRTYHPDACDLASLTMTFRRWWGP